MVVPVEFLLSLIYLLVHLFYVVRKATRMALCTTSPTRASPSPPPLSWKNLATSKRAKEASDRKVRPAEELVSGSKSLVRVLQENLASEKEEPAMKKAGSFDGEKVSTSVPRDFDPKVSELDSLSASEVHQEEKAPRRTRKRPAKLVIPEACGSSEFAEACKEKDKAEKEILEVEGSEFCLVSRRGQRLLAMEDGYGVITNIHGDSKQVNLWFVFFPSVFF